MFADSIATFQILPRVLIVPVALGLPPLEILSGVLVLSGWWTRVGALAVAILTAIFCVALASALVRGLSINCGCFGGTGYVLPPSLELAQDIAILGLAAIVLKWSGTSVPNSEARQTRLASVP